MSLKNEINQLEEELARVLQSLQELKIKVDSLEVQNARLLEKVSAENIQSEGMETLAKLYEEGFHICPTHFAQSREGEPCLFCLAFLKGEQK
mgnify:CR=1 FL=1